MLRVLRVYVASPIQLFVFNPMSTMTSISCSSFGPTVKNIWCHIYYITSAILFIFNGYVTASEYYVSKALNGLPCPTTDLPCHNLSYYVADYSSYFTDDTIFYFLEGTHTLQGILEITNISNITLQGQGHIEQGFHETVMQSTSVIMCSDNNRAAGIQFTNSRNIIMKTLTIAKCWYHINIDDKKEIVGLLITEIINVTLKWVSVQNSSGYELCLVNNYDVVIANSSFANNRHPVIFKKVSRLNIVQSNVTFILSYAIVLMYDSEVEVIIENSQFSHNVGGGVKIVLYGNGSIDF